MTGGELTHERRRARRPAHDPHGVPPARRRDAARGRRAATCRRSRSSWCRTTSTARSRRWTTRPGRASRATSPRSRSCSRRSRSGTVLIHEKMFENRLFFVDRLIAMGARVVLCDPHRALVTGRGAPLRRDDHLARHSRRHGADRGRALRRRPQRDHERAPGRPRLRAHRRALAARSALRSRGAS